MPQKLPKISIITPSFNQAKYIEDTIRSVLRQNYPYLEYIVIDGGSSDGTLAILQKYTGKLTWISEKDKGQSDAINKGLSLISGDIVGYLNSDDILEENCLELVGNFFVSNPDFHWVCGKCGIIGANGEKSRNFVTSYKNIFLKYLRFPSMLFILNYISQPATFWRRDIIKNIGFFAYSYHFSMDYDYWLRIFTKYRLGFIDKYLSSFRIHKSSKGSRSLVHQQAESLQIVRKYTSQRFFLILHVLHDIITSYLYNNLYKA